jgi:hypothetical protein
MNGTAYDKGIGPVEPAGKRTRELRFHSKSFKPSG